jgi:hypothetical protein
MAIELLYNSLVNSNEKQLYELFASLCDIVDDSGKDLKNHISQYAANVRQININQTSVSIIETRTDVIIIPAATNWGQKKDIEHDLNFPLIKWRNIPGKVHHGFALTVNEVWDHVMDEIHSSLYKRIWFIGFSLGAAAATIMAALYKSEVNLQNISLFTAGSPRVGNREFVKYINDIPVVRSVNCADLVTQFPSVIMGYRHVGKLFYFNYWGNVREYTAWQVLKDRFRVYKKGVFSGLVYPLKCHDSSLYLNHFKNYSAGVENPQK